jgi:glycosyltransferase involved in cell wall biosynthesis
MSERRALIDRLYDEIGRGFEECDVRRLMPAEQNNLQDYFAAHVDVDLYDRIAFMIRSKKVMLQVPFLQTIRNLVFIEFDNCKNYMKGKNAGEFSRLYRQVPWCKVIATGYVVTRKLAAEGFDASFTAKCFDNTVLSNFGQPRPIEVGFVGSTNNSIYKERVKLLEQIQARVAVDIDFVEDHTAYAAKLNSIRFFLTPDKDFGEYMIKVFEAMACGCVAFCYDQGAEENRALGFQDMVNVVLFKNVDEFCAKLERLRSDTELASRIALAGETLVHEQYTFVHWGRRIAEAVRQPMRPYALPRPRSFLQRLFNR